MSTKFSALANLRKQPPVQHPETRPVVPNKQAERMPVVSEQPRTKQREKQTQPVTVGKRNNPAYVQRTAYIQKTTDYAVKMKLLQQGGEKEFSELVEELLAEWLQKQ